MRSWYDAQTLRRTFAWQHFPAVLIGLQDQPRPHEIQFPLLHFHWLKLPQFEAHWHTGTAVQRSDRRGVMTYIGHCESVTGGNILYEAVLSVLGLHTHLAPHRRVLCRH